jgi:multiple sugar transport system permease protein
MRQGRLVPNVIRWIVIVLLIVGGLAMVFPLVWLLSTSLRPAPELLLVPPRLLPEHWTLDNYAKAIA